MTDALADADVVAAEIDSADSARKRLAELGVWREMKKRAHRRARHLSAGLQAGATGWSSAQARWEVQNEGRFSESK